MITDYFGQVRYIQKLASNKDIQMSDHFNLSEFQCHGMHCCGHIAFIVPTLTETLELIRKECSDLMYEDVPLHVNSGYRCWVHNKELYDRYGQPPSHSKHCLGCAADIDLPRGMDYDDFYGICEKIIQPTGGGLGRYSRSQFVHVDMWNSPPFRRW